jgi:hypothetical protein
VAGNAIAITITAVDQASERLEAINKRIAGMGAPVVRLQRSFERFSDASGITKLSKGFADLGRGSLTAFHNVARVVEPLAAITGAASIAGMVKLTTAWADFGSQLGFTARGLGISASALQTFQGAAQLAGTSSSALTSGLQTLGENMYNAVGGRAPEITAAFRYLHLSFQNADGSARSVSAVLPEIADRIKAIQNPFAQAAVATALFGGAAAQMLPFLRLGSAGMAEYEDRVRRYGVMNAAGVTAANNMRIAQAGLTLAVQGLGNAVAQQLAPVLDPLLNQMSEWIARNREWIATGIGRAVQQFATWIQSVNWAAVGQEIQGIGASINGVVSSLGGWQRVATGLMVFMAGSWLAGILAPIASIAAAIAGVTASIAALPGMAGLAAVAGVVALAPIVNRMAHAPDPNGHYIQQGGRQIWQASGYVPGVAGHYIQQGARRIWKASARGIVDNNPLNLTYAGQAGTVGQDGRFGIYRTEQDGVAASVRQLTAYQSRGLMTLSQMVSTWAPPGENNTAAYIAAVSKSTGIKPGAVVNMHDPAVAGALINAMAQQETGAPIAAGALAQGIGMGLSTPGGAPANIGDGSPAGTAAAPGAPAQVQIQVTSTAPAGTKITASSNHPGVTIGTLKTHTAMQGAA